MKLYENDFLEYYEKELSYLRNSSVEFSKKYPKVAGRLELSVDESPDPHIERLIESFAFLTARIQRNLESEFPQLATGVLGNIYPQLLSPIPSMSIAYIDVEKAKPPSIPLTIPKHHQLASLSNSGERCKFRTCYPIELWPIKIVEASIEATEKYPFIKNHMGKNILRLRIKRFVDNPISQMDIKQLKFYIHGERWLAHSVHELLNCNVEKILLFSDEELEDKADKIFSELSFSAVGFEDSEAVIPYPNNMNSGYRLLQEYFSFPEKFLFFDLTNVNVKNSDEYFEIFFLLKEMEGFNYQVNRNNFLLGCTPIINLFPTVSEPIRIDQLKTEYRVVPDSLREQYTEIHSIVSVAPSHKSDDLPNEIPPYFTFKHHKNIKKRNVYWYSRRERAERFELEGTDVYLSLMDLDFENTIPDKKTLYAKLLCTNRHLVGLMPPGTWLISESGLADLDISILKKPTQQIDAPEGKELWRLISSLSLNYLSLTSGVDGLEALKEILLLYDFSRKPENRYQISGISSMTTKSIVRRIGNENWRGFCRGLEVALEFEDENYAGNSPYLLASVIDRFLPLYTSINSFTRLVIKRKQNKGEIWRKMPPRIGYKNLL